MRPVADLSCSTIRVDWALEGGVWVCEAVSDKRGVAGVWGQGAHQELPLHVSAGEEHKCPSYLSSLLLAQTVKVEPATRASHEAHSLGGATTDKCGLAATQRAACSGSSVACALIGRGCRLAGRRPAGVFPATCTHANRARPRRPGGPRVCGSVFTAVWTSDG